MVDLFDNVVVYCIVLFRQLPYIVMGVVPSLIANVCVYVCSGQSEEAGGGHEHRETIPQLFSTSVMVYFTGPTA